MSTRALFIGGPWDGVRRVLNGEPQFFEVAEFPPVSVVAADAAAPADPAVTIRHLYRHVPLPCYPRGSDVQAIYLHGSLWDVMQALVNGYREARNG